MKGLEQKHPMQPIIIDKEGVFRFKENAIVRYLLDYGGIDLNQLAAKAGPHKTYRGAFAREDWEQFAQLIGYSVGGAGDLDYVSDKVLAKAEKRIRQWGRRKDGALK